MNTPFPTADKTMLQAGYDASARIGVAIRNSIEIFWREQFARFPKKYSNSVRGGALRAG